MVMSSSWTYIGDIVSLAGCNRIRPSRSDTSSLQWPRTVQHGDDHLPIVRVPALVHDDEIAVANLLVDHRVSLHAQHVVRAAALDEAFGYRERFVVRQRLDGTPAATAPRRGSSTALGIASLGRISIARLSL